MSVTVTDELHLKDYDMMMNRVGWQSAFEALKDDLESGDFRIERGLVAAELGLPDDWSWQDVRHYLDCSPDAEDAFGDLLAALYRSGPIDGMVSPETYIRGNDNTIYRE